MDSESKKLLEIMNNIYKDTIKDFYNTHEKLTRLFKAYDKKSKLYSTITKISTDIYPDDIRMFLDIYHELTEDDDCESVLLNQMETAAKLCNKLVNKTTLELQLEESAQILIENDNLKKIANSLINITRQSLLELDYFVKPYNINEEKNPTYH